MQTELLANALTAPMPVGSGDLLDPKIVNADCLIEMPTMPAQSVDAIISDLPYGTTNCKWDVVIPFAPMWEQFWRLLKPNGAIVLTSSQPFTTDLINSNRADFRYELIWDKGATTGFAIAKYRPLKCHENVLLFYRSQPTYNPQKTKGRPNHAKTVGNLGSDEDMPSRGSQPYVKKAVADLSGNKHPISIIYEKRGGPTTLMHPTEKPVELMRYLVRTYTNPGDVVLDPCCGSGTTCLAAMLEGRKSIGIEKDEQYAKIAINRIHEARGIGV